ncbi:MAG: alginate lyase family protein [Bacteroidales bacterium]
MKRHAKRLLFVVISVVLFQLSLSAQNTISWNDQRIVNLKSAYTNMDARVVPGINTIIESSEKYFDSRPFNIVTDKKKIAPSKDPRDYMSLSRYWWPDPEKRDGLPYIRFDGKSNPELEEYDYRKITELETAVSTLGMLYNITGKEKYAKRTSEILREWFLDPVTGMNPNMVYAQHVPGMTFLRGTGILDARSIMYALNGAKLIEGSKFWSTKDKVDLQEWVKAFLYWMQNSTQGQLEMKADNNHGLWYDIIRMGLSYYIDDISQLRSVLENSLYKRLDSQQDKNGSFPEELARTLGLSYSTFVLDAFYEANEIAMKIGTDMWKHTTPNGRSISRGVEFVYPYYLEPQKWPYEQISPFETSRGSMALYIAGLHLNKKEYIDAARKIGYTTKPNFKSLLYFDINNK